MKDIKIDGKKQRVFILKEENNRAVYIPLNALNRVDYDRLVMVEKDAGEGKMLEYMKKMTLDNGRNALALYDDVIQVVTLSEEDTGKRLTKPDENSDTEEHNKTVEEAKAKDEEATKTEAKAPTRKRAGRPKQAK